MPDSTAEKPRHHSASSDVAVAADESAAAPFIETRGLSKHYGDFRALDDCDLSVPRGEVFGLLGPNGAGKTTLIRLLMGFLRPTAGRATVDGLDCYHQSVDVHRRVAYLPGDARLFRSMRGSDVLAYFSSVRPEGNLDRARQLARRLDVDLRRPVVFCSTGMRQKLALAVVMSIDAPLLILDEPTSNLDPTVRREVNDLVGEARRRGQTVVFSSHVLSEVEDVCDRVAILRAGHIVHFQDMHHLLRQHRIRARLTGTMQPPPAQLAADIRIHSDNGDVTIDTPGELSPLLGWLAQLPLAEVRIEPIGLRAVYDCYHGETRSEESLP